MTLKIHFTVNGVEDYFIISGDTIQEVRSNAMEATEKRGLDQKENNLWSEKID